MKTLLLPFALLLPTMGPLSPREELATFQVAKGFRVELVASEPDIVDPVAMAFDEEGRLHVAEMRGYPNEGVGTGTITSGRIKRLEDRDGDGVFETSLVTAEGLRFPTGIMPFQGGLIVTDPPNIVAYEKGQRRVLYTGFNLQNIQQMVNSPQWGLDNWVYCHAGSNGGTITAPGRPDIPALSLGYRGVRFRLHDLATLEPTSSGAQYGLAPDDYQRWFSSTNSQHLRHIVLPDHYLRRNPVLSVPAVTLDIPDHGAACKVFRISPFESWRVERTRRRKESADANRFSPTELVPGGFITSGCGATVYCADLFPPQYRGNTFVCDPANNLIHRDVLEPKGATFVARRGDVDCEFLASTDTWFRPVSASVGPEGALYVLDFYREAIETPLSLPEDIKKSLNLQSRGRGRIWRIVPTTAPTAPRPLPNLARVSTAELVATLDSGNIWRRLTAQRLLVERQNRDAIPLLELLAQSAKTGPGRAHALWTLRGLGALQDSLILKALDDPEPGVREQGLRLAEERIAASVELRDRAAMLTEDPSPRVRFQAALSLGAADNSALVQPLARLARRDAIDPWTQAAILSSSANSAAALLDNLIRAPGVAPALVLRVAALIGARNTDGDLARSLALLGEKEISDPLKGALLNGLGQGMQNSTRPLNRIWDVPPPALKDSVARAHPFFEQAATVARSGSASPEERVAAARLLAAGPLALAGPALSDLLSPQNPAEVQLVAVRSLSAHDSPGIADRLLAGWSGYSPALRRETLEALFARPARLGSLMAAVEARKVLTNQIEPARVEQLRKHPNLQLRQKAQTLFANLSTADRKKILDDYRAALDLPADAARGKAVFKRVCATCHRLENEGIEVGPDLQSALRNKSADQLLNDILDPSRDVDSRYVNYLVSMKNGRTLTGLIASETASSLTLRRAEKAEDSVLRVQVESVEATPKSLMPEGLEQQLTRQEVADVIAYLRKAVP